MPEIVLIFVTVPTSEVGTQIGQTLIAENLAACVNMIPGLTSFFRWEGQQQQTPELLLLIKTTTAAVARLEQRLKELHPYDNPEFVVIPASYVSRDYAEWISLSTHAKAII